MHTVLLRTTVWALARIMLAANGLYWSLGRHQPTPDMAWITVRHVHTVFFMQGSMHWHHRWAGRRGALTPCLCGGRGRHSSILPSQALLRFWHGRRR